MTTGRHVPAREALALGIFDEMAEEGKLDQTAIARYWEEPTGVSLAADD